MPILVPVLSSIEGHPEFIAAIAKDADSIILLFVVDSEAMPGRFGFAAGEIRIANATMDRIEHALREMNKPVKVSEEWGPMLKKIDNAARLYDVTEIRLLEQKNRFFEELVRELMQKGHRVTIIPLPPIAPKNKTGIL